MNCASVKPGDIVEVDKKGRRFHATITEQVGATNVARPAEREFTIRPLESGVTYRHARSREIVNHWRKARRRAMREKGVT